MTMAANVDDGDLNSFLIGKAQSQQRAGPTYISAHSAELILSDIRPIKIKLEALRSINVLLDEFLFNILDSARSLSSDKLRAGLLKALPTSLGKEALLEAEVELRAYWDRTKPSTSTKNGDEQWKSFHLQWAFELLRVKCEAYSTLNDTDEDPEDELRLNDRMGQTGGPPHALVAPAALYLTAILEALCEHILTNVGRVAARDSSRTYATVQDLFVALCEDDSIYNLFKSMKVYEQIENLSKLPKPKRSKSFSRSNDRSVSSRTPSPQQGLLATVKESNSFPQRSRLSSDAKSMSTTTVGTIPGHSTRSSIDRTRGIKMFLPNKGSIDSVGAQGDGQNGHQRSMSVLSENTKQTLNAYAESERSDPEDGDLLQEFDNLMRSNSTMKVSLTPDRLKSMEVFNKEKGQRGTRRPPPLPQSDWSLPKAADANPSMAPMRARRPSFHHEQSINEDEEEARLTARSPVNPPLPSLNSASSRTRTSSVSTDFGASQKVVPFPSTPPKPPAASKKPKRVPNAIDTAGRPNRTRKITQNRASMDIDDVMAGSDDDDDTEGAHFSNKRMPPHPVSPQARELIEFLAEGPPAESEPTTAATSIPSAKYGPSPTHPISSRTQELLDFLNEGPPSEPVPSMSSYESLENGKGKGSGRLQRMMSKLNIRNNNNSGEDLSKIHGRRMSVTTPPTPGRPAIPTKRSTGQLALANRPIPPRPPPVVPPSSSSRESLSGSPSQSPPLSFTPRASIPRDSSSASSEPPASEIKKGREVVPQPPLKTSAINGNSKEAPVKEDVTRVAVPRKTVPTVTASPTSVDTLPKKPPGTVYKPPGTSPAKVTKVTRPPRAAERPLPTSPAIDLLQLRRLISNASTADECRLIVDMFIAKSGTPLKDVPPPGPVSPAAKVSDTYPCPLKDEVTLESSMLELLLGGDIPDCDDEVALHLQKNGLEDHLIEDGTSDTTPTHEDDDTKTEIAHGPTPTALINHDAM